MNPSKRARAIAYVATSIGTPIVVYLQAKGVIGDLEAILWGAEVTVVTGMAAVNTPKAPE